MPTFGARNFFLKHRSSDPTLSQALCSGPAERFKLKAHWEDRPVNAYTLLAVKPKMKPADPNECIRCVEGPGPDGKDPRVTNPVLNRLLTCQNMTMGRFSSILMTLASGYIHAPVLDGTGLDGAFDFTLSFSAVGRFKADTLTGRLLDSSFSPSSFCTASSVGYRSYRGVTLTESAFYIASP
jgi:uncharacterized protein (TIGR03435 family)